METNKRMFEDGNGYVYPVQSGYKVHWKNESLKPDIDITFRDFNKAHFYLRSVS